MVSGVECLGNEYKSWANPCLRENDSSTRKQIVAGRITLNTNMIDYNSQEDNVSNLIHQTLHVLGFHTDLYEFWAKPSGVTCITPAKIVRGKQTYMLITDGVKA